MIKDIDISVDRLKIQKTVKDLELQEVMDNAVKQLGCDGICVNDCAALYKSVDQKLNCLDSCLCYAPAEEQKKFYAAYSKVNKKVELTQLKEPLNKPQAQTQNDFLDGNNTIPEGIKDMIKGFIEKNAKAENQT